MRYVSIEDLKGKIFDKVYEAEGTLVFEQENGESYEFYHEQDCCEHVRIEDICGNLEDLQGSPILLAEEIWNEEQDRPPSENCESYTWTFYKFATMKGYVDVRWLGESNGYYSERVDFRKIK